MQLIHSPFIKFCALKYLAILFKPNSKFTSKVLARRRVNN